MSNSKRPVRRNKKFILFLIVAITVITWVNPKYSFINFYSDHGQIKRLIQPPLLTDEDILPLLNSTVDRKHEILSEILERQVLKIQNASNCGQNYTLHCGHDDYCGCGCQIHHRATCLVMSYVMNIPLIHDEVTAWPFSNSWGDAFQRLGSNCTRNEKTIYVTWRNNDIPVLYLGKWCHHLPLLCAKENQFEFPLSAGISVSTRFKSLLKENVPDPFLWFVGQFILLTMKLSDKQSRIVDDAIKEMQLDLNMPLVGLQVRRTDKIHEAFDSHHEISEYIQFVQEYLQENSKSVADGVPRTVFVASDDHTILNQVQGRYTLPTWRIVGMKSEKTFTVQQERGGTLHEIVRDIKILSQCNYVVCGLSSNICRLLYEIFAGQQKRQRLKSLDGTYSYLLKGK